MKTNVFKLSLGSSLMQADGIFSWNKAMKKQTKTPLKRGTNVLLVLVERITKETKIRLVPNRNNDLVNQAVVSKLSDRTVQSITLDNDIAFTKHKKLALLLAVPVYFTRPYRSTDKVLAENTNRWIRQYIPKGTDLRTLLTYLLKIPALVT